MKVGVIQSLDCSLGFGIVLHFHETKAARPAGFLVHDHLSPIDRAVFLEQGQQIVCRGFPDQVADVNILRHRNTFH
jgi:hypothetical protein